MPSSEVEFEFFLSGIVIYSILLLASFHYDVKNAFLHDNFLEDYMDLAPRFVPKVQWKRYALKRTIYLYSCLGHGFRGLVEHC